MPELSGKFYLVKGFIVSISAEAATHQQSLYFLDITLLYLHVDRSLRKSDSCKPALMIEDIASDFNIHISTTNPEDSRYVTCYLEEYCIIWTPCFEDEFLYVTHIDEGSQAYIDLYFKRNDSSEKAYAVKTYKP